MNSNVSNEFLATQFPKSLELRTLDAITLAKKRPHPLTRTPLGKRVTCGEIFFGPERERANEVAFVRSQTIHSDRTQDSSKTDSQIGFELAVFVLHIERPNDLVRPVNHEGEPNGAADIHVL